MDKNGNISEDYISIDSFKNIILQIIGIIFSIGKYGKDLIKKELKIFLIVPVLGAILGYLYHAVSPTTYEQSLIVECNGLTKRTYYEMVDQLNKLSTTKSFNALAKELKIEERSAKQIKSIELEDINGESLEKDTTSKLRQVLKLDLVTKSNEYLDSFQHSILTYLNSTPYLSKMKDDQKKLYLDKILFIDKELQKLDSLKDEYTRSLRSVKASATFYNNAFNPTDAYVHAFNLLNQKQTSLAWLNEEFLPINLIEGFKPALEPKSLKLSTSILVGLLIGLVISFLAAIVIDFKSRQMV
jgi:hypothetical protein